MFRLGEPEVIISVCHHDVADELREGGERQSAYQEIPRQAQPVRRRVCPGEHAAQYSQVTGNHGAAGQRDSRQQHLETVARDRLPPLEPRGCGTKKLPTTALKNSGP